MFGWIIIGVVGGFFAGRVMRRTGYGPGLDVVLGVVGAVIGAMVGRWIFGLVGLHSYEFIGSLVTDKLTATRQFSCLPTCPQYCRATPTECVPFFTNPVSSTTQATTGSFAVIAATAYSRTRRSTAASLQGASATMWCSDWWVRRTFEGARRAAIGSTLFRSPGSNKPMQ